MKYKFLIWIFLALPLITGKVQAQKPELMVKVGHTSAVTSVAFSPDGKYILTGSEDQTAKLWDLSGHELQSFTGHSSNVSSVVFSPDRKHILTGSYDGTAKLWDLGGRVRQSFTGHSSGILSVAFSHDGQQILTGSYDHTAKLWDLQGREIQTFTGHSRGVESVAFSPDGKQILTGSSDQTAKLWDLSGRELQGFSGHRSDVTSVAFSPDGHQILTSSFDQIKLWERNGREQQSFMSHSSSIFSAAFSPDGQQILTGGNDHTAKLWDLSGRELQSFAGHSDEVWSVAFSPDGKQILTGCRDNTAKLWDLSGRELQTFSGHSSRVPSVAFSPDGQQILTGSGDHTAKLWDLSGRKLQSFSGHSSSVLSVAFSPDGQQILTGSHDSTAKLWDLNGRELQSFTGHSSSVLSVAFSPYGQQILTGSLDRTAKLWNLNGRELQSFRSHSGWFTSVAFSPDGKQILTGSGNFMYGEAKLWDLSGRELQSFSGHSRHVNSVAFSPDGKHILTGNHDVKLWNLKGRKIRKFKALTSGLSSVAFSPNGLQILTGSYDQTAKLLNFKGEKVRNFTGHAAAVSSLAFSPSGKYILTGSEDHTAKLWDSSTGKNLLTFIGFSDKSNSGVVTDPNQYYMSIRKGIEFLHFKIGLNTYNFDQFDLRLNRPDKILEPLLLLGIDSNLVIQYRNAYYKRLEKYGFTEDMLADDFHVPQCFIQNGNTIPFTSTDSLIRLKILATDTLRLLDRLNVYVNDVPIYGIKGISLRSLNTQEYTNTFDIPLSRGSNKIEVSALNQGGAESLKASTYITYETTDSISDLYLITIGVSNYQTDGRDLTYASKDARDIANFYTNATGFKQVHQRTLTNEQVTKSDILALRALLEQTKVDDQVLIYVSGHGLLDSNYDFYFATHDIDFDQPAGKGILYDEIEGLLDGIPARKKLLLMDACYSGEYDVDAQPMTQAQRDSLKAKGISISEEGPVLGLQNSFEMMKQLFADLRRGSGATVISSSSGVQVSYEKGEWQNGVFTYAFLYGLKSMKADANGDGQVAASEIQGFLEEYVPRLTEGLQKPTFRRENLEFDFRVW